jgi:acetyl esterase/lipase
MTLSIAVLSVLLGSTAGAAQIVPPCRPLEVRAPQGNYFIPGVQGDIPYSDNLSLDAYVQRDGGGRPAVVVIHGGEWVTGSRIAHVGQLLELLTRAGFHWFSVDYRLSGLARAEDSLADLRAALAFIRCHGRRLGIDPARLLLLGEDSGAHLASLLAAERPPGVLGAVLVGGFYDLAALPSLKGGQDADALARLSPMTRAVRSVPPLLVVHGGADSDSPVAQASRYCTEIVRAQGRCQMIEVAGASHRSENWWPNQWGYQEGVVTWLRSIAPAAGAPFRLDSDFLQKDVIYDPSANLKLDAFIPRAAAPLPAVIVVHGGGWEAGDKVTYVTPLFEPLSRAGLAWFSIDYRLTPRFTNEDQLADVRRAIRFVRDNHARFNIDPARVVLVGESASGQLVTLLADEDPSLAGVVSFYGVYDFTAMVTDASPRSLLVRLFQRHTLDDESRDVLRKYSPFHRARKTMAPVLMINGTADRLWPQAQAFGKRLNELGVSQETIALEGAPHGMENWEGHPEWMGYKKRLVEWIREVVARPDRAKAGQ